MQEPRTTARKKYLEIAAPVGIIAIGLMLVLVVLAPRGWQYLVLLDLATLMVVVAYALRRAEIAEGYPHKIPDDVQERCDICDEKIPQKDMPEHTSGMHPSYSAAIRQSFILAAAVMALVTTTLLLATVKYIMSLQAEDMLVVFFLLFASAFLAGAFLGSCWMKRKGRTIRAFWKATRRDPR